MLIAGSPGAVRVVALHVITEQRLHKWSLSLTAELLSLQIDVLRSVYSLTVFTATTNTSQLFSILFNEDEIKTRVGCTVGVRKPHKERLQNGRYLHDIVILQIVIIDVYGKSSKDKCGCYGN